MSTQNATLEGAPVSFDRLRAGVLAVLPVAVGFFCIKAYGPSIRALVESQPEYASLAVVGLAVLCAIFSFLRYPVEAGPARFLTIGLAIAAGIYSLALGNDVAVANEVLASKIGNSLTYAMVLVIPMTLLAIARPSFAIFPFMFIVFHKELTRSVSGATNLGSSDYLPLVEVGFFLACGLCALELIRVVLKRMPATQDTGDIMDVAWSGTLLLAAAIGAHFGNYFMSGLAKVMLDGGVFSWALENPTSSLMLAGYNLGTAPLSAWPSVFNALYQSFQLIEIPTNILTLAAQLLCGLAFLHKRLLLTVTILFDVMHISIFLLTGAMFVTWIVLNTLIVAAVAQIPTNRFQPSVMLLGLLVTLLGNHIFWNARLGWYDSRQVRHGYFVAIDKSGDEHRVPSNFFRESSYLLLGRQFGYVEHRRPSSHIPTSSWGQIGIHVAPPADSGTTNYELMTQARECAVINPGNDIAPDYNKDQPKLFIAGQHRRALEYANAGRVNRYNLYPHHHLSMPFLFRGFEALNSKDIVAYRYVVETVCLDSTSNGLDRRVMRRTASERIPASE